MIDIDKWQEIFHTLKQNKLRTFLTAFGVFWGIFMLVIMMAAGDGLEKGAQSNMGDFARNSMFIWTKNTTKPYKGFSRGRRFSFDIYDLEALKQNIPEIEVITPMLRGGGYRNANLVKRGLESGYYQVDGVMPEENYIDPVTIEKGRFINYIDIKEKRKVALLGKRVYEELFKKGEEPINEFIRLHGCSFKIIGVFSSKHLHGWGEYQNTRLFIPFTTMQHVYNYSTRVGHFSIVGKPEADIKKVENDVKVLLAKRHDIHPEDKGAFGSNNFGDQFKKMDGLFKAIRGLIWIIGIGTLLAGIIGVSNIMLIIIRERTTEFGIKRAIGATPRKIITSVLSESLFLTSLAGNTGLMFGVLIVELVNKALQNQDTEMFRNPEIDFRLAIYALVIIVLSGILAGLIPSKRAISIKPIEAIRTEK